MPTALLLLVVFCCFSSVFLSYPLWLQGREFPLVPALESLRIPSFCDVPLFAFWVTSLALICLKRARKPAVFVFLALTTCLWLLDQNRIQPWLYQYLFFFLIAALAERGKDSHPWQSILVLILAFTYFWSGLQKVNLHFIANTHPWLMEPLLAVLPGFSNLIYAAGVLLPFAEAGIGILLVTRFKNLGCVAGILMHLSILLLIGPTGHSWNATVWPWNLCMIGLLYFVAGRKQSFSWQILRQSKFAYFVILFLGVLPALSFYGLWDKYLSFALYASNGHLGEIEVSSSEELSPLLSSLSVRKEGVLRFSIKEWAFSELNVPPYPEKRIQLAIFADVCRKLTFPESARLIVGRSPEWSSLKPEVEYFTCEQVAGGSSGK